MSSELVVHIIRSHESYKAEYKYIRDMCQQDRPKGVTLPVSPVLQYAIDLLSAKVMNLLESKILRQILSLNIVELVLSEFTPGDSSLSLTDRHF